MKRKNKLLPWGVLLITFLVVCSCDPKDKNQAPVGGFSLRPAGGNTETIFSFDASETRDDRDSTGELRFRWDWESDGIWDTEWSTNLLYQHRYLKPGVYQISLQIVDLDGAITKYFEFLEVDAFFLRDLRDEQEYKTIQIGSQLWMAENLQYETFTGSWCFNDSIENCEKMGRLYNWYAAQTACPAGWHLPDQDDWNQLLSFVGSNPGDQLRSTSGWNSGHNGLNTFGFNAFPAGFRHDYGSYSSSDSYAYFWSANSYDVEMGWSYLMFYNRSDVERNFLLKDNAFSVRCLRD